MPETVLEQTSLAARFRHVQERVRLAARKAGGAPEDVTLIAVSKTHPASLVREAFAAGITDFGENRVQEADGKRGELVDAMPNARWHLIGNLQANKVRRAVQTFDFVHTLDDASLATRLDRICGEEGRASLPVLIQVDHGREASKSGITEDDLPHLIEVVSASQRLKLIGLMTLPPFFDDPEEARPFFRRLRELRDELKTRGAFASGRGELSMGMSHDFETAIEEGATMVRVGTAIFGARG